MVHVAPALLLRQQKSAERTRCGCDGVRSLFEGFHVDTLVATTELRALFGWAGLGSLIKIKVSSQSCVAMSQS
jgi:hypothetical protein